MEKVWLYRFKRRIITGLVLLLLVSTILSMLFITLMTRNYLLEHDAVTTRELAESISSSLKSLMMRRSSEEIQGTITQLGRDKHIAGILILNQEGRVAFSSNLAENGKKLSLKDESCRGCHNGTRLRPSSNTSIVKSANGDLQRNVTVIYNDPECYGCHSPGHRINGKLIIDCSLSPTYELIGSIRFVILTSGFLCLLIIFLVIPYLSRSIDRYIDQVVLKTNEISLIYSIIQCVSKSIDMEDLKTITLDIVGNTFESDEVNIVLPLREGHYRVVNRTRGEEERRRLPEPGCMLAVAISRWQSGELHEKEVSSDRMTAYLPVTSGDNPLALIEICSVQKPFSEEKLKFMDSVINPIAIAFENARLYSIAITDELTGLYTVRHFRSCLDRQRDQFDSHGEKFALLLIDIDDFKSVNDTYGHPVGDIVLKRVSLSIADSIRGSDLAFRYGGEEFAVLLPNTGQAGSLHVAERIRSMVEMGTTGAEGVQIRSTVSIGLALFPENAATVRDLVVATDNALYKAKRSGKNVVIRSEMTAGNWG
jgi:diguanylate cyclase (GGDEF)-like protein